jgi:hypothetical protein
MATDNRSVWPPVVRFPRSTIWQDEDYGNIEFKFDSNDSLGGETIAVLGSETGRLTDHKNGSKRLYQGAIRQHKLSLTIAIRYADPPIPSTIRILDQKREEANERQKEHNKKVNQCRMGEPIRYGDRGFSSYPQYHGYSYI